VEVYSTALQGGPGAAGMRRPACYREERVVQTWLPLLSVALIAAAVFVLASFISGGAEL
jgi:hypothetical protein